MIQDWTAIITNPGGAIVYVSHFDQVPTLEEYEDIDRPNSAKFEVLTEIPIEMYADIDLLYGSDVVLRGVIVTVDEKADGTTLIEAKSKEWLLKHRFTFFYTYPHDVATVGDILNDALTGSYVGLLAQARGLLPPNMFALYAGFTYVLAGGGTGSILGSGVPFHGTTALTLGSGKGSLSAGQYYRDSTGLYVRLVGSVSPRYELVCVHNWCDPGIRLGDISDIAAETFDTPYRLAVGRPVWEYIIKLLKSLGAFVRWRAPPNDPYVYLDASLSTFGGGSVSAGVFQFGTGYEIRKVDPDDVQVHGIIGIGCGDGKTTELSSVLNLAASGNVVLDIYRDGYLYASHLAEVIDSVYADRQAIDCHEIEGPDAPVKCGDWVGISGARRAVVKKIERSGDWIKLWTGRRPRDKADIYGATTSMLSEGSSFAQSHLNMWKDSASGNVTNDVPFVWESEFSDEDGIIDDSFEDATRVYLNFTIGWFKSNVSNVESDQHGHGNATGTGGGSGHGEAGAGGYLMHGATSKASLDDVTVYDYGFTLGANDNYVGVGSVEGIWYDTILFANDMDSGSDLAISYLEWGEDWCSACGDFISYLTGADDYYINDVTLYGTHVEVVIDLNSVAVYAAADGHTHAPSGTLYDVSHYSHYHTIDLDDHEEHEDHSVTDNPEHDLDIDDELPVNLPVDHWTAEQSTGSLKYLTIRIYVDSGTGNVEVPGSPFENYYIGDGVNGIDVTDLIEMGGINTITATAEEYGGTGDVRCEVSLSLSAQVVLTSL